jgi:hypothetical protein
VGLPRSPLARSFYRAAQERFDDAELLLDLRRTTGAVYLAGYGVECMLKALILDATPEARQETVLDQFRGARAHSYDWLLVFYARLGGAQMPLTIAGSFTRVNSWSTEMRYMPATIPIQQARAFRDAALDVMNWADGRL